MSRDLIKRFVHELLHDIKANRITLPTLPEVANKIRTIVDNPNASANDLYDTLKLDAANRISISPEDCIDAIKNAQDELTQIQQIFSR
ncbi:hypothetical protein MNBD_GAMMA17-1041 [hydrothermal vent metagenome]|uniref:Uncharacterized protein n=1 Tax=hydrothermal vent metagenome TaxID=652676 RepID=A0A3B0ZSK4_9ZZZZ